MSSPRKTAPNALDKLVSAELERLNVGKTVDLRDLSMFEFLTKASPHFQAPEHLEALLPYFAKVESEPTLFCFSAPPRHGKACADNTPIATHRGWLRADEVVVGDLVYGSDGKFTTVTGVFPQGEVDLFKVSFSDASSLEVCAEHQWTVRHRGEDIWQTKTTAGLDETCEIPTLPTQTVPRFVASIAPAARGLARCFSVSAPDHLYCAGRDYVVTHNSVLTNHFVARHMIRHPGVRIAYGCYSLDLSRDFFSGEVKDILTSNGVQVDRSRNSKEEWHLVNGSSFKAIAPGSGFTGRGADLIIIDDPFKNRAAAESGSIREMTWDWVKEVCITRRSPYASVIVTHCVAKGEPILMSNGTWKAIEDIQPGDVVRAYENNEFVDRKVTDQRLSGHDPILKVSTKRKSLRVNDRHPLLLATGEWRKAGELKAGDEIVVSNEGIGTETCDLEWAWFVGFMMGDGWVTSWERNNKLPSGNISKSRSWCVCAAKGEYPEMNERIQDAFERFLGRRPKLTKFGYYRLDSNSAGRMMIEVGIEGGAWGKRIPSWVFRLTPELKISFLRGYIDADGSYLPRTKESYCVASVSRELINDARLLAISAGLTCNKVTEQTQLVQAPHSTEPKLSTIYKVSFNFAVRSPLTEVITAVKPDGDDDVYDITVEGAGNFVCEGFVAKNTRWHFEDVIGILSREHGKDFINFPAINEYGESLWPAQWPAERLLTEVKPIMGDYGWSALYMGNPIPRGGAVFGDTVTYDVAPERFKKIVIGIDCAYTKKTHSDYSAAVVVGIADDGVHYILRVVRKQCEASEFATILKKLREDFGSPPIYWYTGGQEKAIAEFFRNSCGVPVKDVPAKEDKFVRAQAVAAAWNAGKVKIPSSNLPWVETFIAEVLAFSGLDDPHDDQVDALAAAFIPSAGKQVTRGMMTKRLF